jgi:hypothetical protein
MKAFKHTRILAIVSSIAVGGLLITALFFSLRAPLQVASAQGPDPLIFNAASAGLSSASTPSPGIGQPPDGLHLNLQTDTGAGAVSSGYIPMALQPSLSCSAPLVLHGSIITGTSPVFNGRLIRNGVPSICGTDYTCSGVQSTSSQFSYQEFNFLNPSTTWQCIKVDLDAKSCAQQVYSAAYLNSFNAANLCSNIQGAMGFSTSGVYGYSFMVPPNTNFKVVNNTTGILPPSSDCADYTMTVTLCSAVPTVTVKRGAGQGTLFADSTGNLVTQVPVTFKNSGVYTGSLSAATVSETVKISVADQKPAAVLATFGKAGAIVPPGKTITQSVPLVFTGSAFTCLPRHYTVNSVITQTQGVYGCNNYTPPSSEVVVGSLLPDENFDQDSFAFHSVAGTHITVTVDTVSAATAFDIKACLSATPDGPCLPGLQGDNDVSCSYAPPSFSCPRFGGLLPVDSDGDNIYYLRINSGSGGLNFSGPVGNYRASILVTSTDFGSCPMVPVLDNGLKSFQQLAAPVAADANATYTSTITAQVEPIKIIVPPSNPSDPSCGWAALPFLRK